MNRQLATIRRATVRTETMEPIKLTGKFNEMYPAGTRVGDIESFDRSIKVEFTCEKHDIGNWVSKDPFVSTWFPRWDNCDPFGNAKHDVNICDCPVGSLVTVTAYPM